MKKKLKQEKYAIFLLDDGEIYYEEPFAPEFTPESIEHLRLKYFKFEEKTVNYDEQGNFIHSISLTPYKSSNTTAKNEYDENNVLRRQLKIHRGRRWYEEFVYDENGWLIKTINYDSHTHKVQFERITTNTIDGELRYVRTIYSGYVVCEIYDKEGKLVRSLSNETDNPDQYFRYEYDKYGRECSAITNKGTCEEITAYFKYLEDSEEWRTKLSFDVKKIEELRSKDYWGKYPKHVDFPAAIVIMLERKYW